MTSVASYGAATTAGNYTLVFSGTRLGDWIESWKTTQQRPTDIAVRQNFWSTVVILDGSYPAFYWEHEVTVYTESGSMRGFVERYFALAQKFFNRTRQLTLNDGDTTSPMVDLGQCYMKPYDQSDPSELLQHRAGMLKLKFIGTSIPTVLA